jgi:hypothetical protein
MSSSAARFATMVFEKPAAFLTTMVAMQLADHTVGL